MIENIYFVKTTNFEPDQPYLTINTLHNMYPVKFIENKIKPGH